MILRKTWNCDAVWINMNGITESYYNARIAWWKARAQEPDNNIQKRVRSIWQWPSSHQANELRGQLSEENTLLLDGWNEDWTEDYFPR